MAIETPCQNLCVLDSLTGLCIGCGRSSDEIANWLTLSPAERGALMVQLPARMEEMTKRGVRGGKTGNRSREVGP
ncbi:DUF1289 domain-containing protein [Candidatus Raskinella chloraquaticus]|jgi:uncharacterized protein|uniref:DUF1289 domain-containing protein n=1 Tax=Candidatus Raskinella chloraquaticus TaxID=1951219 RepID=UPI0026AFDE99